ncbi:MAG: hypothetical protein IKC81_03510 [Paludibacteraceae bacterium]|nr:hypothetical protein [Paludibacteraceae bacterium]
MKKYTLFAVMAILLACVGCTHNKPMPNLPKAPLEVVSGTVYRTQLYSANFGDSLTVDIWTPDNYNTQQTYPVLYMHDGQNLFDPNSTWNKQAWNIDDAIAQLVADGKIEAPIVVGVHSIGESRIDDLMPEKVAPLIKDSTIFAYMDAMCQGKYRGDEYVDFLANTVKPFVDSVFSTKPEMEHTAVMGSSMGGLMSFYALCEAPHVFSKAGCFSTHIGNNPENGALAYALMDYLEQSLPQDETHYIYLDCGDQNIDAPYAPFFPALVAKIDSLGYTNRMLHGFYPGAGHTETDWAARVHVALEYFFSRR